MKLKLVIAIIVIVLLLTMSITTKTGMAQTPTPVGVLNMTPMATVTPDSLMYLVGNPSSTPVNRQADVEAAVRGGLYDQISITDSEIFSNVPITVSGNITNTGNLTTWGNFALTGDLSANDGTLTGDLSVNDVSASGNVTATYNLAGTSLILSGDISAVNGAFTGYITVGDNITVTGNVDVTGDITANDGTFGGNGAFTGYITTGDNITATGNVDVTGDITANDATLSGNLTLESVAFSGPVTFGSQATCIEDTEIAHGLGITPTTVQFTPYSAITATVYVKATDATTITIGIVGGIGVADLYWLAGK